MLREMPCRKERVIHYDDEYQAKAAPMLIHRLKIGNWFGFAEVDIEIPESLRPKFEEMCPFFYNKTVPVEAVPKHMTDYLARTGRNRVDRKKLVRVLSAERMVVYAPLLQWYVNHAAVVTKVNRTIGYRPEKIFTWFVDGGAPDRRRG